MKPFYKEDGIQVFLGDCLEIMPTFGDKSFDLVLTDPPYGITACEWDTMVDLDKLWKTLKPLGKDNAAYIFTSSQPFTSKLVMSNLRWFKYEWVWIKNKGSNFALANKMPIKEHENVLVFYKKFPTYNPIKQERAKSGRQRVKTIVNPSTVSENYGGIILQKGKIYDEFRLPSSWQKFNCDVNSHPTQKPVTLMKYFIKTYTNKGDFVFDPFLGSGTTLIAAKKLGRKAVGIEISEKYCDIAVKRIKNVQKDLFL